MIVAIRGKYLIALLIAVLSGLLFIPFSGAVHLFDWDEIIFAEAAREMIETDDYLTVMINYEPFWEKPPLFIWLQVLSMKVFGVNEFAARFPNAVCAMVTLVALFFAGARILNQRLGVLWSVAHGTAILPFFYFQSGIIDPWFNLFILLGVLFFIFYLHPGEGTNRIVTLVSSAIFLGLAVMTKGPVAVLLFICSFIVYLIYKRGKIQTKISHVFLFSFVLIFTGGFWFLLSIMKGNYQVVEDFIIYQANLFKDDFAGHEGFPGFHFVIILFGMFPASVFFLGSITKKRESVKLISEVKTWMIIILLVVLVLFSIVATKLVHYSSLAYFPVSFLSALAIYHWMERHKEIKSFQAILLIVIALIVGIITLIAPYILTNQNILHRFFDPAADSFIAGVLSADITWDLKHYLPGIILIVGTIISTYLIRRRDLRGIVLAHVTSLMFVYLTVVLFVPRVEAFIQRPAIVFFKKYANSDELAISLGFKSFAQYFYGAWPPDKTSGMIKQDWINQNPVTHVIMRSDNLDKIMKRYDGIRITGKDQGFVFGVIEKGNPKKSKDSF